MAHSPKPSQLRILSVSLILLDLAEDSQTGSLYEYKLISSEIIEFTTCQCSFHIPLLSIYFIFKNKQYMTTPLCLSSFCYFWLLIGLYILIMFNILVNILFPSLVFLHLDFQFISMFFFQFILVKFVCMFSFLLFSFL